MKWATVSDSLRSLRTNEQIAQVAHVKRATVSESLRSLNEQTACFFEQIAHSLFRSQQMSDSLKQIWLKSYFLVRFLNFFL